MGNIIDRPQLRRLGLGTNRVLITSMLNEDAELAKFYNNILIRNAASWMFRHYGFGRCSKELFTAFIDEWYYSRLYNVNNNEWKNITKTVFERDNYTCAYCSKTGGMLECDHIIPISKGGSNDMSNLITACRTCNRQKKDKSVAEFTAWKANKATL